MSVLEAFLWHAAERASAVALVEPGIDPVSYGELGSATREAAAALRSAGLPGGGSVGQPRVGLACPDGAAYVRWSLGLLAAGAAVAPLAAEWPAAQRERAAERLGLGWVLTAGGASPPAAAQPAGGVAGGGGDEATLFRLPSGPGTVEENGSPLAFLRFSSGTTAQSKGVRITHAGLAARVASAAEALGIGAEDRVLWVLPMAHHFAVTMMLYLSRGATVVLAGGPLASQRLDTALAAGVTVFYGTPRHHRDLAAEGSGRPWPTLRMAVATAEALDADTASGFARRYGVAPVQALGIIEAGLPLVNRAAAAAKPLSVGRPAPGVEAELRDEAGGPTPPGEVGRLWIRSAGLFDGYADPPSPRGSCLDGRGFFATGDLARVDTDGEFFLVGRSSSALTVAGFKVFPEEVERELAACPGVGACRVSGRPHPVYGQLLVAEVQNEAGVDPPADAALSRWCAGRLAPAQCPVTFTRVAAIPRTASGKTLRWPPSAGARGGMG